MGALAEQALNGLITGSFYALLALGLTVIWGMLKFVNFAHGAVYMLGAFATVYVTSIFSISWWWALLIVPVVLGAVGMLIEKTFVRRLLSINHIYGFLFTYGIALIAQDVIESRFGVGSQPYAAPELFAGTLTLGWFDYPKYPLFVLLVSIVACSVVAFVVAKTRVGLVIRAAIEKPELTKALGINVGLWITPVFGFGIAMAALAGVLAAPMRAVTPTMGTDLVILLFAVVIIGGLGSIMGSVVAGFGIGLVQGITAYFAPNMTQVVVFALMAIILLTRPSGLFGREEATA